MLYYVRRLAGYQALLELAFHRLGLNIFVSNRGYNGGKTADVVFGNAEVSPVWLSVDAVLAEDQPTIVIILIGTNDVIVQRNADTVEVGSCDSIKGCRNK
jgi:lysophospholipase L1-like esterase